MSDVPLTPILAVVAGQEETIRLSDEEYRMVCESRRFKRNLGLTASRFGKPVLKGTFAWGVEAKAVAPDEERA